MIQTILFLFFLVITIFGLKLIFTKSGNHDADFMIKLLVSHGIYVRTCKDKIGLEGEFIRLASRKKSSNQTIIESINNIINK